MNMCSYKCCKTDTTENKTILSQLSLLKLISDESRLKLLCILSKEPHCVSELIDHVEMSQSLISHHLADLRKATLVQHEKVGRQVYYSLTDNGRQVITLLNRLSKKEYL